MLKVIELLHRWTGGLIGLLLAVLGLSGAILVHESAWIQLPHVSDPPMREVAQLGATVTKLMSDPAAQPESIIFASDDFGLMRLRFGEESGAYAASSGEIVTSWNSKWDRLELWLFDLHHHLLIGRTGDTIIGIAALVGLGFIVTGVFVWWPLRKTFKLRAWPARMSRPAIVRQHRDFGIVLAPLLFLSLLTGAMMTLKPVSRFVLSPWSSPAEIEAASARPMVKGGPLSQSIDWTALLSAAQERFPTAEFRLLSLPRKKGDLISLRMKQREEWLPNGRTMVWFAPEDGRLVAARGALELPSGSQISNKLVYPLHAAKVGGLPFRLVMTASGLGLALLGSLSVWAFWLRGGAKGTWPRRKAGVVGPLGFEPRTKGL